MPSILVVDDDDDIVSVYDDLFSGFGFDVFSSEDGLACLEARELIRPDIMIIDLAMPRLGGIDLVAKIREDDHAVPIIVLTGLNDPSKMKEAIAAGANLCLVKPIDIKILHCHITQLVPGIKPLGALSPEAS